jgi:hypothetical protein
MGFFLTPFYAGAIGPRTPGKIPLTLQNNVLL